MQTRKVIDQTGREVAIPVSPQRIISVVPSITELLVDLGVEDRLIGSSLFCIHPASLKVDTTRVGGTKTLKLDKIKSLNPDLIIANKEENEREQINQLAQHTSVWVTDVKNLEDAISMIASLGEILGLEEKAILISDEIVSRFKDIPKRKRKSCIYLIWRDPFMGVGGDTFINNMIISAGYTNALSDHKRYPEISEDELRRINPEVIMLSSEPYPFKEKHIKEMQAILPASQILIVDGELFSWYGSRLLKSVEYFSGLPS